MRPTSTTSNFSHSLLFTAAAGLVVAVVAALLGCGPFLRLSPYFLAAAWSHVLLDFLTIDTREPVGIMPFWPLSEARFKLARHDLRWPA